jgi:hypothetical protein
MKIHLVEASPFLRQMQEAVLCGSFHSADKKADHPSKILKNIVFFFLKIHLVTITAAGNQCLIKEEPLTFVICNWFISENSFRSDPVLLFVILHLSNILLNYNR